jgi:hypothetical protein
LLELGDLVTVGHLDKRLDVENKLQAKIDRLFKRFFQMKAMKPIIGLGGAPAPLAVGATPVLELTATDATKASELYTATPEPTTTDATKPLELVADAPDLGAADMPKASELIADTPELTATDAVKPLEQVAAGPELTVTDATTKPPDLVADNTPEPAAADPTKPAGE